MSDIMGDITDMYTKPFFMFSLGKDTAYVDDLFFVHHVMTYSNNRMRFCQSIVYMTHGIHKHMSSPYVCNLITLIPDGRPHHEVQSWGQRWPQGM